MAISLQIPQNEDSTTQLGALINHFNASSKSVQHAFTKLLAEVQLREREEALKAKVENGVQAITNGEGFSREDGETTEDFFERLCTE